MDTQDGPTDEREKWRDGSLTSWETPKKKDLKNRGQRRALALKLTCTEKAMLEVVQVYQVHGKAPKVHSHREYEHVGVSSLGAVPMYVPPCQEMYNPFYINIDRRTNGADIPGQSCAGQLFVYAQVHTPCMEPVIGMRLMGPEYRHTAGFGFWQWLLIVNWVFVGRSPRAKVFIQSQRIWIIVRKLQAVCNYDHYLSQFIHTAVGADGTRHAENKSERTPGCIYHMYDIAPDGEIGAFHDERKNGRVYLLRVAEAGNAQPISL